MVPFSSSFPLGDLFQDGDRLCSALRLARIDSQLRDQRQGWQGIMVEVGYFPGWSSVTETKGRGTGSHEGRRQAQLENDGDPQEGTACSRVAMGNGWRRRWNAPNHRTGEDHRC
jgi:hypothetical protein